jgi:hypothetical protein
MAKTTVRGEQITDATVSLTVDVTGILPVANGGTGVGTLTGLVKASGTSNFVAATAGTDYVTPTGVETLTNKTLTSPKIGTSILDTNGNIILGVTPIASAANYIGIQNNTAGTVPRFYAAGSDTNIDVAFAAKGNGQFKLLDIDADGEVDLTASSSQTNVSLSINTPNAGRCFVAIAPRINTTASSATPAIDVNATDLFTITALAAAITSMTSGLTGTASNGQKLMIRIKDNGTARAITWGTSFVSSGTATLLATTAASKTHLIGLIYDSTAAKWVCVAVDAVGY